MSKYIPAGIQGKQRTTKPLDFKWLCLYLNTNSAMLHKNIKVCYDRLKKRKDLQRTFAVSLRVYLVACTNNVLKTGAHYYVLAYFMCLYVIWFLQTSLFYCAFVWKNKNLKYIVLLRRRPHFQNKILVSINEGSMSLTLL